jgi:hypothetical protein
MAGVRVVVSPLVPVLLFVGNGVLFLTFGLVAARLQYRFMKRYPDTAQEVMPEAFWGIRHPEQVLFFYRQRSANILRDDKDLLRLRRQLHVLTWLVLTIPLLSLLTTVLVIRVLR